MNTMLERMFFTGALAAAALLAQPALAQQEAAAPASGPLTIQNFDAGNCGRGSSATLQENGSMLLLRVGRLQAMGPNDANDTCTLSLTLQVNPGTPERSLLQIDRAVEAVQFNRPAAQGQESLRSTFTLNRQQQQQQNARAARATTVTRVSPIGAQPAAAADTGAAPAAPQMQDANAPQIQMVTLDDLGLRARAQGQIRLQATFAPRTAGAANGALVRVQSAMLQLAVVQAQPRAAADPANPAPTSADPTSGTPSGAGLDSDD